MFFRFVVRKRLKERKKKKGVDTTMLRNSDNRQHQIMKFYINHFKNINLVLSTQNYKTIFWIHNIICDKKQNYGKYFLQE